MTLNELQQTFEEMTKQLKGLSDCYPADKNSEHYRFLWDDRVDIKRRLSLLENSKTACCGQPFSSEAMVYCSKCGEDGRGIIQ